MATATWYVRADGKVRGPFEAIHLHKLVQRGMLAWHHELSEDRREWVKAQDHPMFEGLAPRPEPMPALSLAPPAGPPPLPLAMPPSYAPPPPLAAPVPLAQSDWVEQGREVAQRLMKKQQGQPGRAPHDSGSLELPPLGEPPTVYSLDLEDTSLDINVSDATGGWYDDFDLGTWTET